MLVAVVAALHFGACAGAAWAQATPAEPTTTLAPAVPAQQRARVGLVLSGGGARGFAHVGVLRALRELNVPVDLIAGVSMGSVVGGAYAAGVPVDDMLEFVRTTAWGDIVSDRPPRDDLAFRRREDDLILPSRVEFGIAGSTISLPPSAAGNAALEAALVRLLPTGTGDLPVDRLALPFRSVASDLLTGELVELKDTPLFMSIRASLAVPGVFAPMRLSGRLVVDGGLVRNLPVDIARAMGADIVIAVNVGTPLAGESELASALGVARQMMNILTEQNVQRSLRELGERDILIAPDLSSISFLDFARGEAAIEAGEAAVRRVADRLRPLAVSPQAYAAFEQARTQPAGVRDQPLPLARVDVRPTEHAGRDALAALIGLHEGEPATVAQVHRAASRLLGRGEFERVDIDVRDAAGQREVTVTPKEAAWARNRVRVGLEVSSDTKDDHRFVVSGLHTLSWVNTWGAEWRNLLRIGSERLLLTQLWQPLAPGSNWYVAPALGWNASSFDVFEQGRRAFRASYEFGSAALLFGRQVAQWGNVELAFARRSGRANVSIPASLELTDTRIDERVLQARLQIDTLDSLALPGRGWLLDARTERARTATGETRRASSAVGLSAFRVGDWASHVYGEWAESGGGVAPLSLGGFLRLSGTPRDSRSGRTVVLGRLVMARRIGDMPTGLGGAVRLGYSLELGEGFAAGNAVRLGDMRRAGSGFVSVDTRFGPVFLGAGATRHGGSALYLFLGPFW